MLSTGTILAIIFFGFKVLMPTRVAKDNIVITKKEFFKFYGLSYLLWFLTIALFSYLIYNTAGTFHLEKDPDFIYELKLDKYFWMAASVITSVALSTLALFGFIKLVLNEKSDSFWAFYDNMYGFRATPILKFIIILFGIGGVMMLFLGRGSYFKFDNEKILVSTFFEFGLRKYSFKDVKELNFHESFIAPNGDQVFRPHHSIKFNDNYSWSTRSDNRETQPIDEEVFEKISTLTKIGITEKD